MYIHLISIKFHYFSNCLSCFLQIHGQYSLSVLEQAPFVTDLSSLGNLKLI